jgi:lysophospholipase L1-like esterase
VWTRELAAETGLPLVDLARDATPIYEQLGVDGMGALFPFDHTHTGAEGAALNARLISERLQALPKLSVGSWVKR